MSKLRLPAVLLLVAAVAAIIAIYAVVDPAESAWMPKCMVHSLTGLSCPGCGSQRALHSLLNGDLAGMARANALLVVMIPTLAALAAAELLKKRLPRLHAALYSPWFVLPLVALVILWMVLRNILGI